MEIIRNCSTTELQSLLPRARFSPPASTGRQTFLYNKSQGTLFSRDPKSRAKAGHLQELSRMSQYQSAIANLPLLPAERPSKGCLFSCRSKRGDKRDPPKRWLSAEGSALVSLSDQQIPRAGIDKPWVLLAQPQPRHQSCGTRCLPLPRLHGRIALLLCHSQNTMAEGAGI